MKVEIYSVGTCPHPLGPLILFAALFAEVTSLFLMLLARNPLLNTERRPTWPCSGFLYGVLEANLIHQDKNQIDGSNDPNSGGVSLFVLPGLQYVTKRWIVEGGVQIPVVQDLNGTALEKDYIFRAGFRFNF